MTILLNVTLLIIGILIGFLIAALVRYNQVTTWIHSLNKLEYTFTALKEKSTKGSKEEARNEGVLDGLMTAKLFTSQMLTPKLSHELKDVTEKDEVSND